MIRLKYNKAINSLKDKKTEKIRKRGFLYGLD